MKKEDTNGSRAAPTGNKYLSVSALMQGEQKPKEIQEKVGHLVNEKPDCHKNGAVAAFVWHYARTNGKGPRRKTSQLSSKLEAGKDDNITLHQIKQYAQITGQRISLWFGKPLSPTESVRNHADGLKYGLDKLAEMACQNESLQSEIKGFMGNTFYSLFNIISLCNSKLPVDGDDDIAEIRMEIVTGKKVIPSGEKALSQSKELVTA